MPFSFLKCLRNHRHTTIQYAHGLATRGVHYLHQPGPLLQHEIGQDKAYINETLFTFFFVSFILVSFFHIAFSILLIFSFLVYIFYHYVFPFEDQ
ncbi:hypothetical protein I3842_16G070200 [Carya illinoinensis]|uniref:Uncharacterized protein n=1 Tax=Carya illinoinensis TaxID=32201 RepID=A0A922D5N8_CARIL|nr:hypothetical protein I3842_16G070200 [Carya illinoinensis]